MEDSGVASRPLPDVYPFALDDFLAARLDVAALVAKLGEAKADDPPGAGR